MKKILILGSGIGGLSAAIQLAHRGHQVTVLEKNETYGGKIIQIKKNGFIFDGGASFITLTEVYKDFFKSVGKNFEDYVTWKKMDKTTTFYFQNGKSFTLYSNQEKVRQAIIEQFPGEEIGFDRFMQKAKKVYESLYHGPKFARRNYHKFFGFDYIFDKKILSHFSDVQVLNSWKKIVDECFNSDELRAIFSYQATFVGMKPNEALGTYIFFPYAEIVDGMYTVKGGVRSIINGFYNLATEMGVKFEFETEVTKLNYVNEQVTSVETNKGIFNADLVVSNIDGAYFYTNIMPQEKIKTFTEENIKKMKHTNTYFTINLGLKKPIPHLTHHTYFVAEKWEEYMNLVFSKNSTKKLNFKNTCCYLNQATISDPSLAPDGKATLFILVPVSFDEEIDWNEYEETFKNFIYDLLEERGLKMRDLIEEEIIYSPARWGKEFNLWNNIILSFSLNFMQVNGFRFPNKSQEFDNLYFVGSSTIPGPGLPPCITSGELVAERIDEDLKT